MKFYSKIFKIIFLLFLTMFFFEKLQTCDRHHLKIGTNFTTFNNDKQFTFDIARTHCTYSFIEDNLKLNLELGLRLNEYKTPKFIYNFSIFDGNYNFPIEIKDPSLDEEFTTDSPGSIPYRSNNKLIGLTFFKIDNSRIEDFSLDYAEFRYGYGYCSNISNRDFGPNAFFGFVLGKIGFGAIKIDSFKIANNNNSFMDPSFKTGITIKSGFSFNEDTHIKTDFDYTIYFFDKAIHKFEFGLKFENIFFLSKYVNLGGRIKYGIGANYIKFYSPNYQNEFINFSLNCQYLIRVQKLPDYFLIDKFVPDIFE